MRSSFLLESDVTFISRVFREGLKPREVVDVVDWCCQHVRMPYSARQERFSTKIARYIEEPLRYAAGNQVLHGHRVKETTVLGAVQSAKSSMQEALACFAISEDPGPLMWNFQTNEDAKEAAESRIQKLFSATRPVRERLPGHGRQRTTAINFDDLYLIIQGAETRSNLQSKSIRWQINDEVWLWPDGNHAEAKKRVTAFWNSSILNVSTGSIKGSEIDAAFLEADQREWMFKCPSCETFQKYHIKRKGDAGGLTWDDNELTHSGGEWNKLEVAKTVRYECDCCDHIFYDTPRTRREMNLSSRYFAQNPNPLPGKVSFHYNALAVEWVPWADIVLEFLNATSLAKQGFLLPLKEFILKRLAEAWEERGAEEAVAVETSGYRMGDAWDEEETKFMAVDVQDLSFYVGIRQVASDGASRGYYYAHLDTWDDVRAAQLEHGVDDKRVLVDASFGPGKMGPRAVFYECCKYGWTALQGDDKEYFSIIDKRTGLSKRRLYGKMQFGDPLIGQKKGQPQYDAKFMKMRVCPLFRWSNPGVKDILENLSRKRGVSWEIPMDIPNEWHKHMAAEVKKVEKSSSTGRPVAKYVQVKRDNHYRDVELMLLVAMLIARLLPSDFESHLVDDAEITAS